LLAPADGVAVFPGDDPHTGVYEGWDDFYGEWPKYSELLIYAMYDGTTRLAGRCWGQPDEVGAWTNLQAAWIEGKASPVPNLRVTARGTWLGAVERTGGWIGSRDVRTTCSSSKG
jgi:hypothetical protein